MSSEFFCALEGSSRLYSSHMARRWNGKLSLSVQASYSLHSDSAFQNF